jgi:single-stranded-DNA-specific exonuclease
MDLAFQLDALNAARKDVEREAFEQAVRRIEQGGNLDPSAPVLVVAGEDWHPGVVGIVAGRLRERYRRPAVVIGIDPVTRIGKGSGRSQPGVNLGRAIQAAYDEGILRAGGGHAMAAGLTVDADAVPELRAFLTERLAHETRESIAADALEIDALAAPGGAGRALWEDFQRLAPFGPGAPEPVFALANIRPDAGQVLRGGHIRVQLVDMAWRAEDTALGKRLLAGGGSLHVVGRLKPDDWMGRGGVELEIEDIADPRSV